MLGLGRGKWSGCGVEGEPLVTPGGQANKLVGLDCTHVSMPKARTACH